MSKNVKENESKCRFDSYDCDIDDDPTAIGLLPPQHEWMFECPQKNRNENYLIYGTNSWGQYLIIEIKCRPQIGDQVQASYRIIFKDDDKVIYEMEEKELLKIESNKHLRQYKFAGLTIHVWNPYRKLRIKFRGILRRKDTNELIYSRFTMFWSALSNVFDFQSDFNAQYLAKELNCSRISMFKPEDRHEQWGQLSGTVQFEGQDSKMLFLWGNKSKQLFESNFKRKVTRIYGINKKGFSFHTGAVHGESDYKFRYSYVTFGIGTVYPTSGIGLPFEEIESLAIGESDINTFKLNIKEQNRDLEVEIGNTIETFSNIIIRELKINGHIGKCVVFIDHLDETIVDNIETNVVDKYEGKVESLVLSIDDSKSKNVKLSGGKGSSLAVLSQLSKSCENKFFVPKGLIVTTNSYNKVVDNSDIIIEQIDKLERVAWSENRETLPIYCQEVSSTFANQKLPEDVIESINENLKALFGDNFETIPFAVRSSALSEDSCEMSSAGQMTTILGVRGLEAICNAVMKCWSSQFEFIAVEYKRGYGQEINSPMAVVIQEMVGCDSAGVMFTCDPITGDERNVLITGNYGIGESVVSAIAEPDTITFNVKLEGNSLLLKRVVQGIEKVEIGSKLKSIVLSDDSSGTVEVNFQNNNKCCISDEQSKSLAEVGLEVHRHYGDPRDIEWGFKDNRIYLLQSRPITNLDNWTEWEVMHDMDSGHQSEREYFSPSNCAEVLPGAISYFCLSWLTNIWNRIGFKMFRQMFHLSKEEFNPYYYRSIAVVNNFGFFLLKSGLFPFVGDRNSAMSRCIQVMMSGQEFDGPEWDEVFTDSSEKSLKKSVPLMSKISSGLGFIKNTFIADKTLRSVKKRLEESGLLRNKFVFTSKDTFYSLMSEYNFVCEMHQAHGQSSISSMFYNMMLLQTLKRNNDNSTECYNDFAILLSSVSQVVSAQVPKLLNEIAECIDDPNKFSKMNDQKALKYLLHSDTEASNKFKSFLQEYGHRGYKEFDPMILKWGDDPIPVVKIIKTLLNGNQNKNQTQKEKSFDEIMSSIKTRVSLPSKFLIRKFLLPRCQTGLELRERGKHWFIWANHQYCPQFWRLARQMRDEGRLPDPELLFFMTMTEIQILLEERDPTIIARARLRKKVHPIKESFKFDETVIGPNMTPRNISSDIIVAKDGTARMKGTPVSSGKVKARCCVAMNLEEAQNIQSGDILITHATDIGWSPYFPILSGLITEIGGLISHGSVIAREYGLPCLVAVEGAHKVFKTGDILVIDSDSGEVYKVD